jgi:hypothetical protein
MPVELPPQSQNIKPTPRLAAGLAPRVSHSVHSTSTSAAVTMTLVSPPDSKLSLDSRQGDDMMTLHCKVFVRRRQNRAILMTKLLLPIALGLGLVIAYVDSRPKWDDTGITALALFASCCLWGVLGPDRPWLWALAIGSWIPVLGIASTRNYGSLLALIFAFAGAYLGRALGKMLRPVA